MILRPLFLCEVIVSETEALGELCFARSAVDGQLFIAGGPNTRQSASEWFVAEEDISHAQAFSSRKPGGHEGIRLFEGRTKNERASGVEHCDHRHMGGLRLGNQGGVARRQTEVLAVTFKFRVGFFSDDRDNRIRRFEIAAVRGIINFGARTDGFFDSRKQSGAAGGYVAGLALPINCPATALNADIICAASDDGDVFEIFF